MNLLSLFTRAPDRIIADVVKHQGVAAQGPYTALFDGFVAREVNPFLYEAIREALGIVDGAINRMTTLDGVLRVESESDSLAMTINDWMDSVRVNDLDHGLQAYYEMQANEMYEQGCGIGEYVMADDGKDVAQLVVADSKGIHFQRDGDLLRIWYRPPGRSRGRGDGTDQLERVLRNHYQIETYGASGLRTAGYTELNPDTISYAAFHPEANNPYGVSIIRSNEFDARVLLTMKNATDHVWQRFGDPSFHLAYKTKSPKVNPTELKKRRLELAAELQNTVNIKRSGNSADLVTATGLHDEIKLEVIGHDSQVLEVEMPARFITESIVAKTGLAPWMLGLIWGTSERLAQRQADAALHDSRVRFERRRPGLVKIIATMLRARGVTWKAGEWELVQELPSLQDLVSVAQADFLTTQADLMRSTAGEDGVTVESAAKVNLAGEVEFNFGLKRNAHPTLKSGEGEPWAEDDPSLPAISDRAEAGLLAIWRQLRDDVLDLLDLGDYKAADPVFEFNAAQALPPLFDMLDAFVGLAGAEQGPLLFGMYAAWVRGLENAATELDVEVMIEVERQVRREWFRERGLELVKNTTIRTLRDDIIQELEDGVYDGLNPKDVARKLRERFGVHEYDWERLARSEIAHAQVVGKEDQYLAEGIEQYDWITAGDSKVSSVCRAHAAASPHPVGKGPLPMRDSHPNCRCSISPHVE